MTSQNLHEGIYFNGTTLDDAVLNYVGWIDVMGTGNALKNHQASVAANFIMKLQIAAIQAAAECDPDDIEIYPMIDGVYFTTPTASTSLFFLRSVFGELARHFRLPNQRAYGISYRFLVRGGLAFGPVIHGKNAIGQSKVLNGAPKYRERVLVGRPLIQAYEAEQGAPPFGIAIARSARRNFRSEDGYFVSSDSNHFLNWWKAEDQHDQNLTTARDMKLQLMLELDERAGSFNSGYSTEEASRHKALVQHYLPD